MTEHDVTERGKYGDIRILIDRLDNSYKRIGADLKAKIWEGDNGKRRLYLRVRDFNDGRKFNEFSVELPETSPTDSDENRRGDA